MLNDMLLRNAFRPEALAQLGIKAPVRIPKSFPTDADKPYHIPCVEMPPELQAMLDFESKLDRSPTDIGRLMAAGEESATRFLRERRAIS
jgi:NTE family protein